MLGAWTVSAWTVALMLLFGTPRAALLARVQRGVDVLCKCASGDAECPQKHRLAAHVIAAVAAQDDDPDEAVALLLGTSAHETCWRHDRQIGGGPAVSAFQLEPTAWTRAGRAAQAATWLADPVLAATVALVRARGDRGRLVQYAGGSEAVAAELRAYVDRARWATR